MDEPIVVETVAQYFQSQNFKFWVDDHPSLKQIHFPKHRIVIGGHIPNLFGIDSMNRVFAVEAKGEKDLERAIGQALIYKKGVMLSYIAAEKSSLMKLSDLIESAGIGIIPIIEKNGIPRVDQIIHPKYSFYPIYLNDVKNEIEVLLTQNTPNVRLINLGKTQILNYIAPIFYTNADTPTEKTEIQEKMTNEWSVDLFKDSHILNGCQYLGLIQKQAENSEIFFLTSLGTNFRRILERMDYNNQALIDLKETSKSKKKKVNEIEPEISFLIRTLYERKQEYRNFLNILYSFGKEEVSFREIIDEVIERYPTMFIKVFCKKSADIDKLKQLFVQNKVEEIKSKNFLEKYLSLNVYFAFKIQLLHLGVLQAKKYNDGRKSGGFSGKYSDYNFNKDMWVLNPII